MWLILYLLKKKNNHEYSIIDVEFLWLKGYYYFYDKKDNENRRLWRVI